MFFLARARCLSAGLRYLRLTRLPRHDRGPVPRGNRSAASCLCTVLRRALYHYATRSPDGHVVQCMEPCLSKDLLESGKTTNFFSVQRLIATTVNFKKWTKVGPVQSPSLVEAPQKTKQTEQRSKTRHKQSKNKQNTKANKNQPKKRGQGDQLLSSWRR